MRDLRGVRVLVTGGGGMVGASVVRALAARGARVHAHLGPVSAASIEPPDGVQTSRADFGCQEEVRGLVRGATMVVHLAGPPSVAASFADPATYARVHVLGTAYLIEACREADVERVCFISSAEVYGQPESSPVPESAATVPKSPYGASKLGAEMLVRSFCPTVGIQAVVLRPFSVYGPHSPPWSLVGSVVRQAVNAPVVRLAKLDSVRDYVHVDDVANAAVKSLETATGDDMVLNIGSGFGTSGKEIVRLALKSVGRDVPVETGTLPDRPANADVKELVADTQLATSALDWRPALSVDGGLAGAVNAGKASA